MKQLLIDLSALLAMIDARDKYHPAAATFVRANMTASFYLPETIFVETMVLTKARLGSKSAIELGDRLMNSSHFLIVYLTTEDRRTTWDIFRRYTDKEWSYVDCSILAVARRNQVTDVFTFDHHFEQMVELTRVPGG
jgi:predicted nucleic acid-binding protein